MKGITHKQAQRYIRANLDGLLTDTQRFDLETHLRLCETCRADSESFATLTSRLQTEFHSRWDAKDGPSQQVLKNIRTQSRRIIMQKRIDFAFNIFGGIVTLLVLFFVITSVISQFQKRASTSNGTQTNVPAAETQPDNRLLAYTVRQDRNYEIYTVRADGSDARNITNNPASDINPFWSPDGKRIAFQSDRVNGGYYSQIFLVDSDGSNVVQLTTDKGEHQLPLNSDGKTNPWSPDGSKLLYLRHGLSEGEWILQYIDINTGEITSLATGKISFSNISWSPDGKHIGFVPDASPDFNKFIPQFHVVSADGIDLVNISNLLPTNETFGGRFYLSDYYWSRYGQSISFVASNLPREGGDSIEGGSPNPYYWKVYEFRLADKVLTPIATTRSPIGGLWDGNYFITPLMGPGSWTWVYPDGSVNTINPTKECEHERVQQSDNSYLSAVANFSQSPSGNGVIIASCPDGELAISWVGSASREITPIAKLSPAPQVGYIDQVLWSQDDKFIAFRLYPSNTSDASVYYTVNITESRKDPSIQPVKLSLDKSDFPSQPTWQPVANEDLAQPKPTPKPEKTSSDDGLIAFVSDIEANAEIFTMHADGSDLTNLTNNSAYDMNPFWSPDGKRIAFESNRNGVMQIFLMDDDGSNVVQVTNDESDHKLPLNMDGKTHPWSPDGSKILFLQQSPGEEEWTLNSININGENQVVLITGRISFNGISWSPDGKYVGLILSDPQNADKNKFVPNIYVVNADGNNFTNITRLLPADEFLGSPYNFYWSHDGQSLFFIASNVSISQGVYSLGTDSSNPYYWKAYEASPDGKTLAMQATSRSPMGGWWQGTYFIPPIREPSAWTWVRSDGIVNVNPFKNCQDQSRGGYLYQQSLNGNVAISAKCPNGDWWLYWVNSKGTMLPLIEYPISSPQAERWNFAWSQDDRYIAFTISSSNKTDMYVVNVSEVKKDPALQPVQRLVSSGEIYSLPSWQPTSNNEVVEENPTPEPEKTLSRDGLIAFTSEKDGNAEIYTMHADGRGLINLTNNPALDVNPSWSPDGKRIAFESDRTGFRQIFLMNADGSNVIQLTDDKADQWIGEPYNLSLNLWSPDGKKLIFLEIVPGDDKGMLYIVDVNGENKKPLVNEAGRYSYPSWSPDGKHIAFIVLENDVSRIYSTDADGNNLTNVTKKLSSNETLDPVNYSWSSDGQSISFIASNVPTKGGHGFENDTGNPYYWRVYEASFDGRTLAFHTTTRSPIGGYWRGAYFLSGSAMMSSSPAFTWVRSDGTITTANPIEHCQRLLDSSTGGYITGFSSFKQSSNGNVVIGAYCPNGDKWLFWADSKGPFRPLLSSPIHVQDTSYNAMYLWAPTGSFVWSPDDEYIAFNIISLGRTNMYIVNVADALKDPSVRPFQMTIGIGFLYYSPSWQPIP